MQIDSPVHRADVWADSLAMGICALFVVLLAGLLAGAGAGGFGSGRYLAFTLGMRRRLLYRAMAGLETLFIVYVFIRQCISVAHDMEDGHAKSAKHFVKDYGSGAFLLIYSAVSLFSVHHPAFDYNDASFQALEFKRGFGAVFSQTNNEFVKILEIAVLKAEHGLKDDLQALLRKGGNGSLERALAACEPVDEGEGSTEVSDEDMDKVAIFGIVGGEE